MILKKNRQAIDPEDHNEQTSSHEEQEDNAVDRTEDKANQQFPPRNAQRRKRRRDIATNNNRQADSRTKASQDGSLDDRHDDTSLHNGDNKNYDASNHNDVNKDHKQDHRPEDYSTRESEQDFKQDEPLNRSRKSDDLQHDDRHDKKDGHGKDAALAGGAAVGGAAVGKK